MECASARPRLRTDGGAIDILLVEDNPGDVRLTREALDAADLNYSLEVFTNGDDALNHLLEAAPQSYPTLVLLDLNLPGTDGETILETIRSDPQLQSLPVIVLTSSEADEDVTKCYEAAANAYLTKPTEHADFISMMESVKQFWIDQVRLPPVRSRH